jgi:hypothetical protein
MLLRATSRLRTRTSINLKADLEARVYEVRLRMTNKKHPQRPKVEDVIKIDWTDSRVKLLHICPSHDLTHAKVAAPNLQLQNDKAKEPTKDAKSEVKPLGLNSEGNPNTEDNSKDEEWDSESKSARSEVEAKQRSKPGESVKQVQIEIKDLKSEREFKEGPEEAKAES